MNKQQQTQLKKYIKSGKFSPSQIIIIQKALDHNLKMKEIDEIANPKLTWYEMQTKLLEKIDLVIEVSM